MRVEVHDAAGALIEVLDLAHRVGYEKVANNASSMHFDLPRDDPKWSAIAAFREVWLYDDLDQLVDIGRIMPTTETRTADAITADVVCEGWATVLQDDLVAAELIWVSQTVTQILTDILSWQTVPRVSLGTIDASLNTTISMRISYENVMRAAWEVRNIVGGYISVEPVAGTPTTRQLHLRANPGQDIGQRINLGLNLRELRRHIDPSLVMTKLYPLGRGEGPNQQRPSTDQLKAQAATFALVPGGRSTLTIAAPYSRYKGFTAAGAALPTGASAGDTRIRPLKVYRNGVDDSTNWQQGASERQLRSTVNDYNPGGAWTLDYVHADYLIADDTIATFGTIARPLPEKRSENSDALIRTARIFLDTAKQARVTHELRVADLARVYPTETFERINLHDQVNVYDPDLGVVLKDRVVAVRYGDMADPESFEIAVSNAEPLTGAVQIADRVRKYESMPDGATNVWVDSFEDNLTPTHPYTRRIYIPPDAISINKVQLSYESRSYRYYVSAASNAAGGGVYSTTSGGGTTSSSSGGSSTPTSSSETPLITGASPADTGGQAHQHTVDSGTHDHGSSGSHTHTHGHSHPQNAHAHSVSIAAHSHTTDTSHSHTTNTSHNHSVTLTPGIIESGSASAVTLSVDGTAVAGTPTSRTDFDLTPYLSKDADGKILRGWHSIEFLPNANSRIQGAIVEVVFLQSRGVVAG